jgi:hypothetical protein
MPRLWRVRVDDRGRRYTYVVKNQEAPRGGWAAMYERCYIIGVCGCFDYGPGNVFYVEAYKQSMGDVCECDVCHAVWTRRDMPDLEFWWWT